MNSAYHFPCAAGRVRPVRSSEETRRFAYESLHHKYGSEAQKQPAIVLDNEYPEAAARVRNEKITDRPVLFAITGDDPLKKIKFQDKMILRIAAEAPLRIAENERISGAATWGFGIRHYVPVSLADEPIIYATSHTTQDFAEVIRYGIDPLIKEAEDRLSTLKCDPKATEYQIAFVESVLVSFEAMKIWHGRYIDLLKQTPGYEENLQLLEQVPFKPARNFKEAVQSLWFTFAFLRLCGNWPGIGRIDEMLGPYLKKDLADGTLTLDEAREFFAHFFIKGCEWITGDSPGSGDAQHYQNIILGGIDADGNEVTNEVSFLVLDIIEEFGISDFPTSVRVSKRTDRKFLHRVAEVCAYGGGVIAFYNEDLIINAFLRNGYPLEEARAFTNDGCWEVQIPGKTFFRYVEFDALQVLQQATLKAYREPLAYTSWEDLYQTFLKDLDVRLEQAFEERSYNSRVYDEERGDWQWIPYEPATPFSLFEHGCLEKARQYWDGGPKYVVMSPHIGGLVDLANSLYAIRTLCFDQQKISLNELIPILKDNWKDAEPLRQYARHKITYWGNDNDEVDALCARILDDFATACTRLDNRSGFRFPPGVSTFGRQIKWAAQRLATPCGTFAGEVLSANMSPAPGTDYEGATAIIRSYCKSPLVKMGTGAALDIRLLPNHLKGEAGVEALMSLVDGFVELGGCFMQPDVVDPAVLEEAKAHPENYQTLSVRVSGWNARFVTLAPEWQDCVIAESKTSSLK